MKLLVSFKLLLRNLLRLISYNRFIFNADLYACKVGEDPIVDQLFLLLCDEVNKETDYMKELLEIQASLILIFCIMYVCIYRAYFIAIFFFFSFEY